MLALVLWAAAMWLLETVPSDRAATCQGEDCTNIIDTNTCCRFDRGHKADLLLCSTCCPNCFGGAGKSKPEEA